MLHSSALGSRNTFGQDVVNRENGPQSMGALNEYAACWSRKCENIKRCELPFSRTGEWCFRVTLQTNTAELAPQRTHHALEAEETHLVYP
jgi:hypothetical protein